MIACKGLIEAVLPNLETFNFEQDSLERASNKSSASYDPSHNTETLPATQRTMTTTA